MKKILVSGNDDYATTKLIQHLKTKEYDVISCSKNTKEIMQCILNYQPVFVIMDIFSVNTNGLNAILELQQQPLLQTTPMFALYSDCDFINLDQIATSAGAVCYFSKPFDSVLISERLDFFIKATNINKQMAVNIWLNTRLEIIISDALLEIGVPAHAKGYCCLKEAIFTVVQDPAKIHSLTKVLYPEIAAKINCTSSAAERSMRVALELMWQRIGEDTKKKYFDNKKMGYSNENMPTSEVIATISAKIRPIYEYDKQIGSLIG